MTDKTPVDRLDTLIFRALLLTVALAPLPLASVYGWSRGCLGLVVGALLLAWSRARLTGDQQDRSVAIGPRVTTPLLLAALLLLVWMAVQAMPGVWGPWRPPLWDQAAQALGRPTFASLSLDPGRAPAAAISLGTDAGVFWLALHYCRDPQRARQAITVLAVAGAAYAALGLLLYGLHADSFMGIDKRAYANDLTSSFVNRNNYATYAGLGWLSLLALTFRGLTQHWSGHGSQPMDWLRGLLRFIEQGGWRMLLGAVLLASALLLSHSRGGLLSTLIATAVLCLSLQGNGGVKAGLARRFSLLAIAVVVIAALAGGRGIGERLASAASDSATDLRSKVYSLTLQAIADRPFTGFGAGTFEQAFRLYRSPEIGVTFAQAHDSYLETAMELGLPATALILLSLLTISLVNAQGARQRRRDAFYPCLGLAASTLVGVHALVDFSIQIPAVAVTYALLLGVSLSQSWSSRNQAGW